jgi:hypothetical protein
MARLTEAQAKLMAAGGQMGSDIGSNRAVNPTWSTLIQNLDEPQARGLLQFSVSQTLEQSTIPIQRRAEIFEELGPSMAGMKTSDITQKMRDIGMGQKFEAHTQWLLSKKGASFIEKELPGVRQVEAFGLAPSAVKWSGIQSNARGVSRLTQNLQERVAQSIGIDRSLFSLSYAGGHQASFNVAGLGQQTSKVHEFLFQIQSEGIKFKLPVFEASEGGFVVQSRDTISRGFTKGESVFVTPQNYFTDLKRNRQTQKYSVEHITGRNAFFNFQMSQMDQLSRRIRGVRQNANLSIDAKQNIIKDLVTKFKQAQERNQFFVAPAAVLGGALDDAGVGQYTQNLMSKAAVMRQTAGLETALSDLKKTEDPRIMFKLLEEKNVKFIMSSGQAGKIRGIVSPGYDSGVLRLPHMEPLKALSELTPARAGMGDTVRGLVPRNIDLYKSPSGEALVKNPLFAPKGVQAIGTLIPSSMATAKQAGMGLSELLIPEGTVLANEKLFRSGAMDIGQNISYHVKASGPGSVGGGIFGDTVAAIFEGGEVSSAADPSKKIVIPGLKATRDAQGNANFLRALGVKTQEEYAKKFPGGLLLRGGEFLGFDPGTGRQVSSIADKNITETIVGVARGASEEDVNLLVSRNVGSYINEEGRLVANDYKMVGTILTKEGQAMKLHTHTATAQQYRNLIAAAMQPENLAEGLTPGQLSKLPASTALRAAERTEMAFHASIVKDPALKLAHMAGAVKFEMEDKILDIWKSTGAAKTAKQKETQQAIKTMAGWSNEEMLKRISSGSIVEQLSKISKISDPQMARVKEILGERGKRSMEQRIAAVSLALFGNLPESQKMQALGNVFAPFTNYGRALGLHKFGRDASGEVVERYFNWGGNTTASQIKGEAAREWRQGKTLLKELDDAFSGQMTKTGKSMAQAVLESDEPFRFITTGFAPRDYGALLGTGSRASLEPRFFDIAMATPELQPAFREITGRTTNLTNVMSKISQTLKGTAPAMAETMALKDAMGDLGKEMIGNKDVTVNLGMTENVMARAQARLNQLKPELGGKVLPEIFVPGGEDIRGMGLMVTGTGVEKAKPLRQVYTDYLKAMTAAKDMVGSEQINQIAKATGTFQESLQNVFKTQLFGAPKGGAHGVLRAPVKGSAYLHLRAPGADFMEVMGIIPRSSMKAWDKDAALISNFKDNFTKKIRGGESLGRQLIISQAAAEQMFGEAISDATNKNQLELADQLRQQRAALHRGESILGMTSRHPGIGIRSATVGRIWMDKFSAGTKDQFFVRAGTEFLETVKGNVQASSMPDKQFWLTSIAQGLNADHDGDRINVFLAAKQDSQAGLQKMMATEHRHAVRYNMIKDIAKQSVSKQASLAAGGVSSLQAFATATQGAFTGAEEQALRAAAKTEMSSILAHSAPEQIVPKVSNTFTEMKFAIAHSSLDSGAKADIFRFFEAAEQVPISAKHLSKSADYGLEVVSQMQKLRAAMFSDTATQKQALDTMFDIFANDEVVANYNTKVAGEAAEHMIGANHYTQMKANILSALQDLNTSRDGQRVVELLRRKTMGKASINEMFQAFEHYKPSLAKVYGHALTFEEGARDLSRNVLAGINESVERAGQVASGKLPTKGIVGLAMTAAAGMLVAGSASIALGPTWSDGGSGGAYADPDYLFPDEMEAKNAMLHGNSMPTPISGNLITPSYEATIHMAPGAYQPASLAGRLGTVMTSNAGSARLELSDNRSSLDTFSLSRIKNEII